MLVIGAKGSGKSALFQMYAKYEDSARKLSGLQKDKVLIVTGTGFNDIKELQTDDFTKLLRQENANFDYIWELYIAVKIAIKLGKEGYYTGENLIEFYKHAGLLYTIFAKQVYKGKREATVISWVLARITDGLGGKYPRELINLANYVKNEQIEIGSYETDCLISGRAIKRAFNKVSTTKCDTYLSEFPELREHFDRFRGKDVAKYSREELIEMMDGLEPSGDEMIRALYETGVLEAQHGKGASDSSYEVPKLFRFGLGLILRGRP